MNAMLLKKLSRQLHPNAQRGASLLEGIAYLGVAAIVVLGAVSLLTNAFSSAQTNRASEEIISIRTAVKKLYMGQAASYGAVDFTASLITAKVFPSTLALNAAGTGITNSWNGAVTVAGTNGGSTFTLTYANVPKDACINLVSGASGWTQIDQGGLNAITAFPATPANAASVCSLASNAISFTAM
jgi:hypothetical protein